MCASASFGGVLAAIGVQPHNCILKLAKITVLSHVSLSAVGNIKRSPTCVVGTRLAVLKHSKWQRVSSAISAPSTRISPVDAWLSLLGHFADTFAVMRLPEFRFDRKENREVPRGQKTLWPDDTAAQYASCPRS